MGTAKRARLDYLGPPRMDRVRRACFLPGRPMTNAAALPVVSGEPVAVSEGVYVISDNHVPIVPNIGAGDSATLVIDTGLGQDNGAYVLEHARRLGSGRPVYVATTHVDPGHGFGMGAFKRKARIVFHKTQVKEMHRQGHAYVETFSRQRPGLTPMLRGVEFVEPDIVFADGHVELDLGGHRAVLRHYGPGARR
jgi:glyoxylase-like metal-dependent hydrolase (beta-lactamase superfamily II)